MGTYLIARGASDIISAVLPDETNIAEETTEIVFNSIGFENGTGSKVHQVIGIAESMVSLSCAKYTVKIIYGGRYTKKFYKMTNSQFNFKEEISVTVKYHNSIRVYKGSELVLDVHNVINNSNDLITLDKIKD